MNVAIAIAEHDNRHDWVKRTDFNGKGDLFD